MKYSSIPAKTDTISDRITSTLSLPYDSGGQQQNYYNSGFLHTIEGPLCVNPLFFTHATTGCQIERHRW